jgi:glycosyltransferase involved in cell wall biosynthesis
MPRVSLLLVVKDGMPYLPEAVDSIRAQTFRDFEVIVQDAASTDGSLEFLTSIVDLPAFDVVSERDRGIGDGYNRALQRAGGEIVGSIDADNLLVADTLERVVAAFDAQPDLAAIYGAVVTIAEDGAELPAWVPETFDLLRLLTCELVPPFSTAFFSRAVCGDELRFDEALSTCADFDLWLRLARLPILRVPDVLGKTRLSPKSMSRSVDRYEEFVRDKIGAVARFLAGEGRELALAAVHEHAVGGIYAWAAQSVHGIEGESDRVRAYEEQAALRDPELPALRQLRAQRV